MWLHSWYQIYLVHMDVAVSTSKPVMGLYITIIWDSLLLQSVNDGEQPWPHPYGNSTHQDVVSYTYLFHTLLFDNLYF